MFSITNTAILQEVIEQSIIHDGIEREFILYIPSNYEDSGDEMPLVFNFHGFTSNANQQRQYSAMDDVAETNNFIVCYPEGIGNAWNVGWNFGSTEDDIGFTEKMIDYINDNYNIDSRRIYSCGMSNGGFFSYRLACELSDKIAAIASVTGSFTTAMLSDCSPSRKIPVMEVHGTNDAIVPYNGMEGTAIPIEDVVAFWLDHNTCNTAADTTAIANTNAFDGCTSERIEYLDCEEESEVVFVKITGGGHTWPGASIPLPGTSLDYNGSQLVWDFFNRHRLPAVLANNDIDHTTLSISPNPANHTLQISGVDKINSLVIYDITGHRTSLIYSDDNNDKVKVEGDDTYVNVGDLINGTYILKITDHAGQTHLKKFIKI